MLLGIHAQTVGELLLCRGTVPAQVTERHHVPLAESERRQYLLEALAHDPGDASDQDRGLHGYGICARFADAHGESVPGVYPLAIYDDCHIDNQSRAVVAVAPGVK